MRCVPVLADPPACSTRYAIGKHCSNSSEIANAHTSQLALQGVEKYLGSIAHLSWCGFQSILQDSKYHHSICPLQHMSQRVYTDVNVTHTTYM